MTYSPGSPGYSSHPPGSYGAPSPSYAPVAEPGPSKLPQYLNIAVVVLGSGRLRGRFGPVFTASAELGPFSVEATSTGGILLTLAARAGRAAGRHRVAAQDQEEPPAVVALLAVLGVLVVIEQLVNRRQGVGRLGGLAGARLHDPAGHRRGRVLLLRDRRAHATGAQAPLRAAAVRPVRAIQPVRCSRRLLRGAPSSRRARRPTRHSSTARSTDRVPAMYPRSTRRLPAGPVDRRVLRHGRSAEWRPARCADPAHRISQLQPAPGRRHGTADTYPWSRTSAAAAAAARRSQSSGPRPS